MSTNFDTEEFNYLIMQGRRSVYKQILISKFTDIIFFISIIGILGSIRLKDPNKYPWALEEINTTISTFNEFLCIKPDNYALVSLFATLSVAIAVFSLNRSKELNDNYSNIDNLSDKEYNEKNIKNSDIKSGDEKPFTPYITYLSQLKFTTALLFCTTQILSSSSFLLAGILIISGNPIHAIALLIINIYLTISFSSSVIEYERLDNIKERLVEKREKERKEKLENISRFKSGIITAICWSLLYLLTGILAGIYFKFDYDKPLIHYICSASIFITLLIFVQSLILSDNSEKRKTEGARKRGMILYSIIIIPIVLFIILFNVANFIASGDSILFIIIRSILATIILIFMTLIFYIFACSSSGLDITYLKYFTEPLAAVSINNEKRKGGWLLGLQNMFSLNIKTWKGKLFKLFFLFLPIIFAGIDYFKRMNFETAFGFFLISSSITILMYYCSYLQTPYFCSLYSGIYSFIFIIFVGNFGFNEPTLWILAYSPLTLIFINFNSLHKKSSPKS